MSRSGNAFIAATEGTSFTMYAMMRIMGIPLSPEQAKCQASLERRYPPVIPKQKPYLTLPINEPYPGLSVDEREPLPEPEEEECV